MSPLHRLARSSRPSQTQPAPREIIPQATRSRRSRLRAKQTAARDTLLSGQSVPSNSKWDAYLPAGAGAPWSTIWPIAAICFAACLGLGFVQFAGSAQTYQSLFPPIAHVPDLYWPLRAKAWWVGSILIGFLAMPAALMALLPGNRLRDCNLSVRGFIRHFWIYAGLYAAVLPIIWLVSLTPTFTMYYPMYDQAGRSWFDLLMWEGMYVAQFVALEFFFRGFLVGGLGRHIGILSVPLSVIPYMMIHFVKPVPEVAGSVIAGFVLGWLAWKTKSIWGGVCVHCAVAATMDLLALSHKGQLPWLHS
jgi:uncharacterized protein